MKRITLTQGYIALVDNEDYEILSQFNWFAFKPHRAVYAIRNNKKGFPKTIRMHRQILNVLPGIIIDHINGDGLDNRKCNLRISTYSLNGSNSRPSKKKLKGVDWNKRRSKWRARITCQRKTYNLGYFNTKEEAALSYNDKSLELFGEFACLNEVKP